MEYLIASIGYFHTQQRARVDTNEDGNWKAFSIHQNIMLKR